MNTVDLSVPHLPPSVLTVLHRPWERVRRANEKEGLYASAPNGAVGHAATLGWHSKEIRLCVVQNEKKESGEKDDVP
jgi:hypothetical protein